MASRSRFLFLVIVVVLAVGLGRAGGSTASSCLLAGGRSGTGRRGSRWDRAGDADLRDGGVRSRAGGGGGAPVLAKAVILADEATGQVLFERNAGAARAMASTTKVMTALLALERLDERKVVTIGAGPPQVGEESLRLQKGERLTVRQLLLGLLLKSANDAGVALAEAVDGSEAAFVRRMNRKATALRLSATHYVTPTDWTVPGTRPALATWPACGRWPCAGPTSARWSPPGPLESQVDRCRFVDLSPRTSCSAPTGGRSGARPASPTGPDAAWSPRPAAVAAAWSRSRSVPQRLRRRPGAVRTRLLQVRPGPPGRPRPAGVGRPRSTGRAPDHHRRRRPGPPGPARPGPPDPPRVRRAEPGRGGPVHERGALAWSGWLRTATGGPVAGGGSGVRWGDPHRGNGRAREPGAPRGSGARDRPVPPARPP